MDAKQLILLAFQVSILATVFGLGLKATPADLLYLIRKPSLLIRSLVSVFVLMPLVAMVLVRWFDYGSTTAIALMALSISPVPPLLPRREGKAGGHASYSVGLMVLLAVLAVGLVPLAVEVLERIYGRPMTMSAIDIARTILIAVVLPLVAGQAVRALLPQIADRIEKPVSLVANVLLPLAVAALLAGTWRIIWGATGGGAVLAMAAFVVTGMVIGHLMGGPKPEHSAVLALSTSCRHPGIALAIAATNYPGMHFGGTILLYTIVSAIIGIPYLVWQRKRVAASARPGELEW